jgi:hypothetical protein
MSDTPNVPSGFTNVGPSNLNAGGRGRGVYFSKPDKKPLTVPKCLEHLSKNSQSLSFSDLKQLSEIIAVSLGIKGMLGDLQDESPIITITKGDVTLSGLSPGIDEVGSITNKIALKEYKREKESVILHSINSCLNRNYSTLPEVREGYKIGGAIFKDQNFVRDDDQNLLSKLTDLEIKSLLQPKK